MPVTIYEIASRAGVSPATVSRVLNGTATVAPELASRVRAAAKQLSYRPNRTAQNLRMRRSSVIALVIPDIENPYYTGVARGAERAARAAGYSVVLCNTDDDDEQRDEYLRIVADERMAGAVVALGGDVSAARKLTQTIDAVVLLDPPTGADLDSVGLANEESACAVTRHLLSSTSGGVACIAGPEGVASVDTRVSGFRLALDRARGTHRRHSRIVRVPMTAAGGRAAVDQLLSSGEPPKGIFLVNTTIAMGVIEGLRVNGFGPRDVQLACFGRAAWMGAAGWPMTTVEQPTADLGTEAVALVIDRLQGYVGSPRQIVLPTAVQIAR